MRRKAGEREQEIRRATRELESLTLRFDMKTIRAALNRIQRYRSAQADVVAAERELEETRQRYGIDKPAAEG